MISISGIQIESLKKLLDTWIKDGYKYTDPKSNVCIYVYGDHCSLGDDCSLGDHCSLGYRCSLGDHCSLGDDYQKLDIQPLWFSGPRYSIGYYSPATVKSGCIVKPIGWWEENIKRCAEEHDYTPKQVEEYVWRIKVLADWMKLHNVYDLPSEKL